MNGIKITYTPGLSASISYCSSCTYFLKIQFNLQCEVWSSYTVEQSALFARLAEFTEKTEIVENSGDIVLCIAWFNEQLTIGQVLRYIINDCEYLAEVEVYPVDNAGIEEIRNAKNQS